MMLPEFNRDGVLPPTANGRPYRCTLEALEARFVDGFKGAAWRRVLFQGWDLLRQSVSADAPTSRWWLWGGFVSAREEPLFGESETLDALLIVAASDARDPVALARIEAAWRSAPELHRVDVHNVVFEFPEGDDRSVVTEAAIDKYRSRATRVIMNDVTRQQVAAGFVEVLA